jgi:hypothetical protein
VTGTRGDWAAAFQRGLLVVLRVVLAAHCAAVADLVMGRLETHPRHARRARDRHPVTGG